MTFAACLFYCLIFISYSMKHLLFSFLAGALALGGVISACSETEELVSNDSSINVLVSCDPVHQGSATKMVYAGVTSQFSEGDAIGVYAVDGSTIRASNVKFTLSSNQWVAESKVPYSPYYTYFAYYPYSDNPYSLSLNAADLDGVFTAFISDSENRFWSADQSSKTAFDAANLMAASATADESKVVSFTMLHKRGLAVIDGVGNSFAYASDPSTSYPVSIEFNGNIPYAMDSQYYFLMKPGQNTNFAGLTYNPSSGKYSMNNGGVYSLDYSLQYSVSTDGGTNWTEYSSTAPEWLSVSGTQSTANSPVSFTANIIKATCSENDKILKQAEPVVDIDLSNLSNRDLSSINTGNETLTRSATTKVGDITYSDLVETANCYMVHAPGTYRFPLVYGNSIKESNEVDSEGKYIYIKEKAYTAEESGSNIRDILVNHEDVEINNPWIKNNNITIENAELIWQDVKGLISEVGIDGDYLTFTVSSANIAEGNALVSAVDNNGLIAWSWHIWVTPETLSDCQTVSTGSHDYNVAPVNVGWVAPFQLTPDAQCKVKVTSPKGVTAVFQANSTAKYKHYGYCPYYQWGKPIPEPPSNGIDNTTHTVWDIDGNEVTLAYSNTSASIGTNIQNPLTHYYNSSTHSPYNENKYNYWDINNNTTENIKTATNKTIYDPCPPGFCVPTGNLYFYMGQGGSRSDSNWNSTLKWKTWTINGQNIFFPAAGNRDSGSVSLYNVRTSGHIWAASPYSSSFGRDLFFYSRNWSWDAYHRSAGLAVRPVFDDADKLQ